MISNREKVIDKLNEEDEQIAYTANGPDDQDAELREAMIARFAPWEALGTQMDVIQKGLNKYEIPF